MSRLRSSCALWLALLLWSCPGGGGGGEAQTHRPSSEAHAGQNDAQPTSAPRVVLQPEERPAVTVPVEIARTPEQRARGLMFRLSLDADAGMLFLFERPQQLSFWMRNTLIPLDMIFIESSMRVLGIVENAEPRTETSRSVPGESQYVLEVNGGFSERHGLGPGTVVRFEGVDLKGVEPGDAP